MWHEATEMGHTMRLELTWERLLREKASERIRERERERERERDEWRREREREIAKTGKYDQKWWKLRILLCSYISFNCF